jgi:hypothetical protein
LLRGKRFNLEGGIMNIHALIKRFSEHSEVLSVRVHRKGVQVELSVSTGFAWRMLEALRIYSMVEEALHEFGKKIKIWEGSQES